MTSNDTQSRPQGRFPSHFARYDSLRKTGRSRSIIWLDGRIIPAEQARIPVFDSAYLYGMGIFETMRAVGVVPLFLRHHDVRLRRNARSIGLRVPLSSTRLRSEITRLLKKLSLGESMFRIVLSSDERNSPRLVMIVKPFKPYPRRCYREGARLVIAKTVAADTKKIAAIKTTSYLTKMLARREAKQRGADEAILLDANRHVTEGASSNLFIVKKGQVFTPPLSDGLLPGTRRDVVMTLVRQLKIPVAEKTLTVQDLITANEIFITSTLKDVMPVGFVEKKRIARVVPGPMTQRIIEAYLKLITPEDGCNR